MATHHQPTERRAEASERGDGVPGATCDVQLKCKRSFPQRSHVRGTIDNACDITRACLAVHVASKTTGEMSLRNLRSMMIAFANALQGCPLAKAKPK